MIGVIRVGILAGLVLVACAPEDGATAQNGAIGAILGAKIAQMMGGDDATLIGALLGGLLGSAVPDEALCEQAADGECAEKGG